MEGKSVRRDIGMLVALLKHVTYLMVFTILKVVEVVNIVLMKVTELYVTVIKSGLGKNLP